MKNFSSYNDSLTYQVIISGVVYRGTRQEIQQIIVDWRENHD